MLETIALLLWIVLTGVAAIGGYIGVRRFVSRRLRYVEAVRRPLVPWAAGAGAALLAAPVVWLLPVVGAGTAVLFGIGVGGGVAAGRKDFPRLRGR